MTPTEINARLAELQRSLAAALEELAGLRSQLAQGPAIIDAETGEELEEIAEVFRTDLLQLNVAGQMVQLRPDETRAFAEALYKAAWQVPSHDGVNLFVRADRTQQTMMKNGRPATSADPKQIIVAREAGPDGAILIRQGATLATISASQAEEIADIYMGEWRQGLAA